MPEIEISLPTLHPSQQRLFKLCRQHKFVAARCGRRWGKTTFALTVACDAAARGFSVGWFNQVSSYTAAAESLEPIASFRNENAIATKTGGRLDFLDFNDGTCGRSYNIVLLEDVAFYEGDFTPVWKEILPTLMTSGGRCLAISTPNSPNNWFYSIFEQPSYFAEFVGPTHENPIHADNINQMGDMDIGVYCQDFMAQFVDWADA